MSMSRPVSRPRSSRTVAVRAAVCGAVLGGTLLAAGCSQPQTDRPATLAAADTPTTTTTQPPQTIATQPPPTAAPATTKPHLAPPTTRRVVATTTPRLPATTATKRNCDPAYPDVCLPDGIGDFDCAGGSGNGPNYVKGPIRVLSPDPFRLDADHNGWGCET